MGYKEVWIGASDVVEEGRFIWIDDVGVTEANMRWGPNEPNNSDESYSSEDCVHISIGFDTANDNYCGARFYGLCEKKF